MCWKSQTRLKDLPPDHVLVFHNKGRTAIRTTPRELLRDGRLAASLTVTQVERAFSDLGHGQA